MMQIMVTYRTLEEKGQEKKGTTLKMEIKRKQALYIPKLYTTPIPTGI